jgi:hypothetical protein
MAVHPPMPRPEPPEAAPADETAIVRPPRPLRPAAGTALLAGLLGAAGYAAFAGGAARLPEEAWLQAGVALLALVAAAAWLGPGPFRVAVHPAAAAGLALLGAFAAWTGASLLWTVAPDRTWLELNRAVAYALVVAVALAAGSAVPRAIGRVAAGWLVVATAVALYALAGKVAPGVVDHARGVARLRAPLEYWNALALVCVLAVPVAVRLATARDLRAGWRLGSLVALFALLCTIGLTYSRGAILALVVALVVVTVAGGRRLPGLAVVVLAAAAVAPVLALGWTDDALTANAPPLGEAIAAGRRLGGVLLVAAALLALAGWGLLRVERRATWTAARSARTWAVLGATALALLAGGVTALTQTERGLRGSVEAVVDDFTEVREDPLYDPGRLLSASSGNRWAWWREAIGAWSDEPVLGWGAGSFPVSRRLYRVSPADVQQPHSVPLQFLAETGVIGALLGLGALALLLAAAIARVRAMAPSRERDLAGALLAAAAAWCVHACADWDWDIPGVTVPVLLMLGVLGARRPAAPDPVAVGLEEARPARALALGLAALVAAAVVVSAALPAWSQHKADAALGTVQADRSPAALEDAAAGAELAARLDPLAVRPLFAAAAVAEARDRLLEARGHLLEATERQPYSIEAWRRLTRIALALADREGVRRASQRVLELDPADPETIRFVSRAQGILAPPEASPTATGTPLPPG